MPTRACPPHAVLEALQGAGLCALPLDWPRPVDAVSPGEVARELARERAVYNPDRLRILVSPAARPHLEEMARQAQRITRQRFGRVMNLYAPLYLSNVCTNRCLYCGFHAEHAGARRRLAVEEAVAEAQCIASGGMRDILLVSGEDRAHVSIAYLEAVVQGLRPLFASIAVEIYQLTGAEYQRLFAAGVDGVTLYQETYDRNVYARVHGPGGKGDFQQRLAAQEEAARAGMRRLGIGALLGLQDWRFEAMALGLHADTLMRLYWQSRVSISFPRLRPAAGVDVGAFRPVADADLVHMILALRLCFPDLGLVLSTRESAALRDRVALLGVTQMSAGSRTAPGGYAAAGAAAEQFEVADTRAIPEVVAALRAQGLDPVWKDWDPRFQRSFQP